MLPVISTAVKSSFFAGVLTLGFAAFLFKLGLMNRFLWDHVILALKWLSKGLMRLNEPIAQNLRL